MQRTHINKPFTLIEMMVVVGIIAIIMGISVPAFKKITVGSGVDAASRMLSSQLMLARAEAIARRKHVAVIIPGQYFTKDPDDRNNYHFASFRSAFVTEDSGNSFKFVEWVPGTQWTFLPVGAVLEILETTGTSKPIALDMSGSENLPNSADYTIPNDSTDKGFGCDSGCTSVKDDSDKYMVDSSNPNSSHGIRAIVFKPNGRCVQKNYLTVMEGVVEADSNETTRLNRANLRVMEVNQYTGQVRYLF